MFFTQSDLIILSRRVKESPRNISEEMRGWKWSEPPVLPPSHNLINVSDITNGICHTLRNLYLKAKGVKMPSTPLLIRGAVIHESYSFAIETVKRLIYEGVKDLRSSMLDEFYNLLRRLEAKYDVGEQGEVAKAVWDYATNIYSSELEKAIGRTPYMTRDSLASLVVPFFVEYPLDGSLVGLGDVRADAFLPQIPMFAEVKTGAKREKHLLSLAGYAVAYESVFETPVDFGMICYAQVNEKSFRHRCELIALNDRLRASFYEERDRGMEIIDKDQDPGLPKSCYRDCPYLTHCLGDKYVKG